MNVVLFCHSLLSDWNHGNAHFLRGLCSELALQGHGVRVFEPADAWSVQNLIQDAGALPVEEVQQRYPHWSSTRYDAAHFDVERAVDGANLVLVHEWTEPSLVTALGRLRARGGNQFKLLFHDTHHRSVTDSGALGRLDLSGYDGVLAFGEAVRERYLAAGWASRVWTFHEAADVRIARPMPAEPTEREDLVWIGNWGDDERSRELEEFLFGPAATLRLRGSVYGVRYPEEALGVLRKSGLRYGGWLPNYRAAEVFGRHRVTVHVPRRPYAEALPGIPTIRVFEALASGIPLISAPWSDAEHLFGADDFVRVRNRSEMEHALRSLLSDSEAAAELAERGRRTILERHTCAHRVAELSTILRSIDSGGAVQDGHGRANRGMSLETTSWD